jgi:hypothetical protein
MSRSERWVVRLPFHRFERLSLQNITTQQRIEIETEGGKQWRRDTCGLSRYEAEKTTQRVIAVVDASRG